MKPGWPRRAQRYRYLFENVGGKVFDAVMKLVNDFARIPLCGRIAHYNDTEAPQGPDKLSAFLTKLLVKRC